MDAKVSKEQIIAYLYGELPEGEAREVATYLQRHPREAAEYAALEHLRGGLQGIQDVEVAQPVIMLGSKPGTAPLSRILRNRTFQRSTAAAAVIIIGLLLAKLIGLNISYRDQALTIAFSKDIMAPATETPDPRQQLKTGSIENDSAQQQLMAKVNEFLARENEVLTQRLASLESNVKDLKKMGQQPAAVAPAGVGGIDQNDMEVLARKISKQNLQLFSEVIKTSQVQQDEYIKSLFSEFAAYLQSQRVEDLMKIEASLKSLKQESDLKKLETDQVIARIIQTVNDKNY